MPRQEVVTVPASPVVDEAPSSRPTSVPEGYLEAYAAEAQALAMRTSGTSLAQMVPIRLGTAPSGLSLRASFLLAHVDDQSTLTELATYAMIPLDEVTEVLLALADVGVVALGFAEQTSCPQSGIVPRFAVEAEVRKTG